MRLRELQLEGFNTFGSAEEIDFENAAFRRCQNQQKTSRVHHGIKMPSYVDRSCGKLLGRLGVGEVDNVSFDFVPVVA